MPEVVNIHTLDDHALSDYTHNDLMGHAQSNIVSYLETKLNMDPCPAIKVSAEMLEPAYTCWSQMLELIYALRKQRDFLLQSNNRLVEERRTAESRLQAYLREK